MGSKVTYLSLRAGTWSAHRAASFEGPWEPAVGIDTGMAAQNPPAHWEGTSIR